MYRKCATEVSVRHQRLVTEALLELMGKMSFEEISVTQLCQSAGVTRRVFYHLFSNKQGALHALVDHKILDIESYRPEVGRDALRFFLYWQAQKKFLDVLAENGMSGLLLERMITSVLTEDRELAYWLRRNGWQDYQQEIIIYSLSGLMGLVYSWYYSGFRKQPEEMAALLEQMMSPFF